MRLKVILTNPNGEVTHNCIEEYYQHICMATRYTLNYEHLVTYSHTHSLTSPLKKVFMAT